MSKIEELIEKLCPDGVEYKPLKNLCKNITTGKLNANAMDKDGNYPFFTCDAVPHKIDKYAFDTEAILISGNGSQVGHINYYNGKFNAYQRTYVLSNFINISVKFLLHILKCKFKRYIFFNSRRGSVPYITLPMLDNFEVPVPPMEVQREIVEVLDNFAELSAELSAELQARRKQYEFYRDKLLTFDTSIEELSLSDIYEFKYGDGNTIPENKGQFPVYGSNGWVGTYYDKFNCEDAPVIGHIGAYAGIVNFAKGKCYVTYNGVICKHKNQNVNQKFAYYLLKNQNFLKHQKGPQPFISYELLKNTIVKVPPLEIQERIVNILDNFETICSDLGIGLPAEIEARQKQYEFYRDKLLNFKRKN